MEADVACDGVVCAGPIDQNDAGGPADGPERPEKEAGGGVRLAGGMATRSPAGSTSPAAPVTQSASKVELTEASLGAYAAAAPLARAAGVEVDATEASRLGAALCRQLGTSEAAAAADPALASRVYRYYLPLFLWLRARVGAHRAAGSPRGALVIGLSAPQGCGKTTVTEQLVALCAAEGLKAVAVSIDDFYLRGAEQDALAAAHPENGLLKFRGNAGSHDLALGVETLRTLRGLVARGSSAPVPRYDKSLRGGYGDRAPQEAWPVCEGPVDVVLLEGWMLGFERVDEAAAAAVSPDLAEVNARLPAYAEWHDEVDAWAVIKVGDPSWVYKWRLQAEEQMRAAGKPGLTDEQVADFVSRFLPAYEAYLPGLYARGPPGGGPSLVVAVDEQRGVMEPPNGKL